MSEKQNKLVSLSGWRLCAICGDRFKRKSDKVIERNVELTIAKNWCSDCWLLPF